MKATIPWADCPAFYALPAGLDAVLVACRETRQPMSAADRHALADWLRLERTRVERHVKPMDRHYVAIDRRALEAILWGLDGPTGANETAQIPQPRDVACDCVPTERTTVRRADGTVRFVMCSACASIIECPKTPG